MISYIMDSSAWIEYFGGTVKGTKVRKLIENEKIAVSIIAIAELADKFERENRPFDAQLRFIQSHAAIIAINIDIALSAAKLKKTLRTQNSKFSLADAIHLATAHQEKAILVTTDFDFSKAENVMIV